MRHVLVKSYISLLFQPVGRLKLWFVERYVELSEKMCVWYVAETLQYRQPTRERSSTGLSEEEKVYVYCQVLHFHSLLFANTTLRVNFTARRLTDTHKTGKYLGPSNKLSPPV